MVIKTPHINPDEPLEYNHVRHSSWETLFNYIANQFNQKEFYQRRPSEAELHEFVRHVFNTSLFFVYGIASELYRGGDLESFTDYLSRFVKVFEKMIIQYYLEKGYSTESGFMSIYNYFIEVLKQDFISFYCRRGKSPDKAEIEADRSIKMRPPTYEVAKTEFIGIQLKKIELEA